MHARSSLEELVDKRHAVVYEDKGQGVVRLKRLQVNCDL